MSRLQSLESAILAQTRRGLRTLLAVPSARAGGLARVEDIAIPGVAGDLRARYYEAADATAAPLIVYFHGGGFVCCDIDTHDSICSWLGQRFAWTRSLRRLSLGAGGGLSGTTAGHARCLRMGDSKRTSLRCCVRPHCHRRR